MRSTGPARHLSGPDVRFAIARSGLHACSGGNCLPRGAVSLVLRSSKRLISGAESLDTSFFDAL